jgi:hypothetical protein
MQITDEIVKQAFCVLAGIGTCHDIEDDAVVPHPVHWEDVRAAVIRALKGGEA